MIIDNVVGHLDSAALASMLTAPIYTDRLLQESRILRAPTNVLVEITGNNIILKGDLTRRVLKCRIAPSEASPHKREFSFNPLELVKQRRQQIVCAVITVILAARNGMVAGSRIGPGRMASFEEWDDCIRQTICWLMQEQSQGRLLTSGAGKKGHKLPVFVDPMQAVDEAVQEDPDAELYARLLRAWKAALGTGQVNSGGYTAQELRDLAYGMSPAPANCTNEARQELRSCLTEIAPDKHGNGIDTRRLGNQLKFRKDRVDSGMRLRAGRKLQNAIKWFVENI